MSNEIDFLGRRLQGWSGELAPQLVGIVGYFSVQSGREASDVDIAAQLSDWKDIDLVPLLMRRLKEDFVDTGKVGSVEIWKKGASIVPQEKAVDFLKVSIPSWGFKQTHMESKLKSYMEATLNFRPASGNLPFADHQVITLNTSKNLDDYRKHVGLMGQDLILLVETASKRIVSLVVER